MCRDPQTKQEYIALHLATNHAEACMQYPEVVTWSCEHWPDFMEEAADATVQEEYDRTHELATESGDGTSSAGGDAWLAGWPKPIGAGFPKPGREPAPVVRRSVRVRASAPASVCPAHETGHPVGHSAAGRQAQ